MCKEVLYGPASTVMGDNNGKKPRRPKQSLVRNSAVVCSGCGTLASFWPVEFPSGWLGDSYLCSDTGNGLAHQTRQIPRPYDLLWTVGPSASSSGLLITEK
jgi:hypothetical protein